MKTSQHIIVLVAAAIALSLLFDLVFLVLFLAPVMRARRAGIFLTFADVWRLRRAGLAPALAIEVVAALRAKGVESTIAQVEEVFAANRNRSLMKEDLVDLVWERVKKMG